MDEQRKQRALRALEPLVLNMPVRNASQRQCSSCGSQWRATRYGMELSPQTIFGAELFTCPDCARHRATS